jgi:hypothetical protein
MLYFAVSTRSALNLGYRHLLPTLPFLFAFTGVQVGDLDSKPAKATRLGEAPQSTWVKSTFAVISVLSIWLILGNLYIYPHYLSSFNELVGPSRGYQVLVDSNIDWGQDLKRLQKWMLDEQVTRIKLAWFGSADPSYYRISYDPLPGLPRHFDLWEALPFDPQAPESGIYAISVSILQELHRKDEDKTAFSWFRARESDDRVGYSILIYRVGSTQ